MANRDFTYCPHCATELEERFLSGQVRRACPNGDFVQFHDPKVAVIALVQQMDRLLLTKRAVEPELGKWALPGGYMDAGEMPEEALRRELLEEVALLIDVQELLTIFPISNARNGHTVAKRGIVLAYRASIVGDPPAILAANDDIDEACWFAKEDLPENIAFESTRTLLDLWQQGDLHHE